MGRSKIWVAVAAVAGAVGSGGAGLLAVPPAQAATSVSAVAVTVNPSTAGAVSSYSVAAKVASAIPSGGTVTLVAPSGTNFVSCASNCGSTYSVSVSGGAGDSASIGSAVASPNGGGSTANQVVLSLSSSSIAAGDQVTVRTQDTSNPTAASASYTLTEATSSDTGPATSAPYTITSAPAAAITLKSGDDQSAQVNQAFASPLAVEVADSYGNPVSGAAVHFAAPVGGASGTFDSSGCPADPSGTVASDCYVRTGPDGVATASTLTADSTTGSFHVTASTTTINGTSAATFTLTNTASVPSSVKPGTVQLSNTSAGATGVTYRASFTATTALSNGSITLTFPNGTAMPAASCSGGVLGCSGYTVTYGSGSSASVASATTSDVAGPGATATSSTPNRVVLALGALLSPASIPAGSAVTVTADGVGNPSVASTGYVAEESTSADPGVVATAPYTVNAGPATALTATSGGGQTALVGTGFASPLVVTAGDAYGNPAGGTQVTFTIGTTNGASARFANNTSAETDTTGANGRATTSQITANGTPGSYTVTARLSNGSPAVTYTLTNSAYSSQPPSPAGPGTPATVAVRSGGGQSATVGTAYATPLSVTVTDSNGTPVSGTPVTFAAPTSGASGSFANGATSETDTTDANGVATTSHLTANHTAGNQTVVAYTTNQVGAAFNLVNTAGAATAAHVVSGQNQTAAIETAFAHPFVAEAVDQYGNPIPYSGMLFGGPTSGPGGTFANGMTYEAQTADATGQATSSTFTANNIVGTYQMAAGLSNSNYSLFTETNSYGGTVRGGGSGGGYWLTAPDGAVQAFGDAGFYGSAFGAHLSKPVVAMTGTPGGDGYWLVAADGGVFNYGPGAKFYGSAGSLPLAQPIVGMAADPATGGYWLVASDGGVFSYNAPFYGSTGGIHLNKPIVGMAAAPGGNGYWLVASDGGVFAFGPGARFYGSTGNMALNRPVVGMAAVPGGSGYWLVASDGGIFAFGPGARFYGSTGNMALNSPVVGMAAAPGGNGYWLVGMDGGVFSFGPGAPFRGSASSFGAEVVAIAPD